MGLLFLLHFLGAEGGKRGGGGEGRQILLRVGLLLAWLWQQLSFSSDLRQLIADATDSSMFG